MIKRILAIVAILVVVILFLLVPAITPEEKNKKVQLSAFRTGWADLTTAKELIMNVKDPEGGSKYQVMSLVGSPVILKNIKEPESTLYIAVGVEKAYEKNEIQAIRDFVNAGGKAIIADDFGKGNTFASYEELPNYPKLGVAFFEYTLFDENYYNNVSYPKIWARIETVDYLLIMNQPTGIWLEENTTYKSVIMANGSVKSYIDTNQNNLVDIRDKKECIPVIVKLQYGEGQIIFIGDPSIFIKDVIGLRDPKDGDVKGNKEFVVELVGNLLPYRGKVIFDESRHSQEKFVAPVFSSIRVLTVVTTDITNVSPFFAGICLILIGCIVVSKDKESWIHKFDISRIKRRESLPDTREVQIEKLKKTVYDKVRIVYSLSKDEMAALTPHQLSAMIKDPIISEFALSVGRTYSQDELKMLGEKIRKWGK